MPQKPRKNHWFFHCFRCQNLQNRRWLHTFSTSSQRALANGSPETLVLHVRCAGFGLPGPWSRRQLHGFSTPALKNQLVFAWLFAFRASPGFPGSYLAPSGGLREPPGSLSEPPGSFLGTSGSSPSSESTSPRLQKRINSIRILFSAPCGPQRSGLHSRSTKASPATEEGQAVIRREASSI